MRWRRPTCASSHPSRGSRPSRRGPNRQRQLVSLGDILASDEADAAVHPLEVALGRDIAGRAVLVNLAEMPHVLISGAPVRGNPRASTRSSPRSSCGPRPTRCA